MRNDGWALYTELFTIRSICLIEREFLQVLDFDLSVLEEDLLDHHRRVYQKLFQKSSQDDHEDWVEF